MTFCKEQQGGISAPTERQMQYIRLLEHRNRLKKKLEDKSRREAQLEAREKGFAVLFAGANEERHVPKPRQRQASGSASEEPEPRPRAGRRRRSWASTAKPLPASAQAPGSQDYEDDFEDIDDTVSVFSEGIEETVSDGQEGTVASSNPHTASVFKLVQDAGDSGICELRKSLEVSLQVQKGSNPAGTEREGTTLPTTSTSHALLHAVQRLSESKQRHLLQMLTSDSADLKSEPVPMPAPAHDSLVNSQFDPRLERVRQGLEEDEETHSRPLVSTEETIPVYFQPNECQPRNAEINEAGNNLHGNSDKNYSINLRLHNTWNGSSLVSLAFIELKVGERSSTRSPRDIQLNPAEHLDISTELQESGSCDSMKTNLARVLRSSSEANLWTALIPNLAPLGLVITHEEIKRTLQEGGKLDLRVCNPSTRDAASGAVSARVDGNGVRDLDIYVGSKCIWTGVLDKGGTLRLRIVSSSNGKVDATAVMEQGQANSDMHSRNGGGSSSVNSLTPRWLVDMQHPQALKDKDLDLSSSNASTNLTLGAKSEDSSLGAGGSRSQSQLTPRWLTDMQQQSQEAGGNGNVNNEDIEARHHIGGGQQSSSSPSWLRDGREQAGSVLESAKASERYANLSEASSHPRFALSDWDEDRASHGTGKAYSGQRQARSRRGEDVASHSFDTTGRSDSCTLVDGIEGLPVKPAGGMRAADDAALAESWDSLEHFSRTNRSRLDAGRSAVGSNIRGGLSSSQIAKTRAARVEQVADVLTQIKLVQEQVGALANTINSPLDERNANTPDRVSLACEIASPMLSAPESPATFFAEKNGNFESTFENSYFECPILPRGNILILEALSTWGDPHYIGLSGIDIFDEHGDMILLEDPTAQVTADPRDVNVLDGHGGDPRTPCKLFDGCNHTCDDMHVWLAPYEPGQRTVIRVKLNTTRTVGAIRIWNYNKSREHSYRGVRHMRIHLDLALIFEGEIRKGAGVLAPSEQCSELILFTLEDMTLLALESHGCECDDTVRAVQKATSNFKTARPATAERRHSFLEASPRLVRPAKALKPETYKELGLMEPPTDRPKTSASSRVDPVLKQEHQLQNDTLLSRPFVESEAKDAGEKDASQMVGSAGRKCQYISVRLLSNWGDPIYIGLTGLEPLLEPSTGKKYDLSSTKISANPSGIFAYAGPVDPRTPDKLLNGENEVCDSSCMWLAPFEPQRGAEVVLDLGCRQSIRGLRVWNYNKSVEDSLRGARAFQLFLDDEPIGRQGILRMAPGYGSMSYAQDILIETLLADSSSTEVDTRGAAAYISPPLRQDYEAPILPQGLLLRLIIHSTWGDSHYVGLDAIVVRGADGRALDLHKDMLHAAPDSVRVLGVSDCRLPANLIYGGERDTKDGSNSWLAPLAKSLDPATEEDNSVYVMFDQPTTISQVHIWNYSKDASRGVRHFSLCLDERLIFMGQLGQALGAGTPYDGQAIVFTNDPQIVRAARDSIPYCGSSDQDVVSIDEGRVIDRTFSS